MVALKADPDDPEDFDVTFDALEQGVAERRARRAARGVQVAATKQPVTIRLDRAVVDHFKAGGAGWQTRINAVLRKSAGV